MSPQNNSPARLEKTFLLGLSLIELIIAIVLMGMVILCLSTLNVFSRYHVLASDRRIKAQNEVSRVMMHITKEIGKAIGDVTQSPVTIAVDPEIAVWIDSNQNAKRDPSPTDGQIAYDRNSPTSQMRYYANYTLSPNSYEVLSGSITGFAPPVLTGNYVTIQLTGCYDPDDTPFACGTRDNPIVNMTSSIKMPQVSTH